MNPWRYTDLKCTECKGQVVQDIWKLEYYCLICGLIHDGVEDEDNTHTRMQDNLHERQIQDKNPTWNIQ